MARATSSISLVMCGIIKVSERSSPRRYSGFVELAKALLLLSHKADAFGAVADEVEPFGDGTDDQQRTAGRALIRAEHAEHIGHDAQRRAAVGNNVN